LAGCIGTFFLFAVRSFGTAQQAVPVAIRFLEESLETSPPAGAGPGLIPRDMAVAVGVAPGVERSVRAVIPLLPLGEGELAVPVGIFAFI